VNRRTQRAPRRLDSTGISNGVAHIAALHPVFHAQVERHGMPPLWGRTPGFETLLRIILEQQVSLASANALRRRLLEALGSLSAQTIAAAGEEALRGRGVTRQKAGYCVGLARAVLEGQVDLAAIARASDDEARAMLVGIRGIGPWSAEIYQLMALRRPDIWPTGDLALLIALQELHGLGERPDNTHAAELTAPWAPYRSVGARLLWQAYLNRGTR
jgi:DNA-3-methyladenine glycosylase II